MKSKFFAGVAAAALMVAFTAPSHANLMLSIDGGAPIIDSGGTGIVNFNGSAGDFFINVTTGLSTPVIGTAIRPSIDLNSVDVADSHGGTLTLALTDTNYIGGGGTADYLASIGGTLGSGGTLGFQTFMDCGNTAFGHGTALTSQSFGGGAFSGEQNAITSACSGAYSLTEVLSLTLPGGLPGSEMYSGDASLAIPEPSAIALFGAGLIGLGFAARRKGQTAATAA